MVWVIFRCNYKLLRLGKTDNLLHSLELVYLLIRPAVQDQHLKSGKTNIFNASFLVRQRDLPATPRGEDEIDEVPCQLCRVLVYPHMFEQTL